MYEITRRSLLKFIATLPVPLCFSRLVSAEEPKNYPQGFADTISTLKAANESEMNSYEHYRGYCERAVRDNYKGIAYLFSAFAASEYIHAENYRKVLSVLGVEFTSSEICTKVDDTKNNLRIASKKELTKIKEIYPDFLNKLKEEAHAQAVESCMWSWKSHKQHREMIEQIYRYSGLFFPKVAKKIESTELDFHVCRNCGSTLCKKPELPCEICNHPVSNYTKIQKPV